ncbi:MAG: hypothetical protein QXO01_03625 [Nitrososphaerota archaeon]
MLLTQIKNDVLQKVKQLSTSSEFHEEVRKDREALKEMLDYFPFRKNPEMIDKLTPKSLYNPGGPRDWFFYFFEFKLKRVGRIRVPSDLPWREACEKIDLFKQLLKLLVNDEKLIHEKIDDERWLELKGWGGDKHYVKKLLFIYYPDQVMPTFKTDILEMQLNWLGLFEEAKLESRKRHDEDLNALSVGKKFELYNELILKSLKDVLPKDWDTLAIARLFRELVPFPQPVEKTGGPLGKIPLLYEPVNELGVVLLFGMYHRELGFPYIIKVQQTFPDMIALDEEGNYCRIEFEYRSSTFIQHGHDISGCDYIICWVDDLEGGSPIKEKVISLKEEIFEERESE